MNYFDLHCDTPFECHKTNSPFFDNSLAVSGRKGAFFEKWEQFFAIWISDTTENPFKTYKEILNDFKFKVKKRPQNLKPFFSVEGGAVLEGDICRLYSLKQDKIKLLTLCWNGENEIAGGSQTEKDLTCFGKRVIRLMNCLKIGCDLSHLNRKSFYHALENAKYPLCTHSNCDIVCNHKRNLDQEQIKALCLRNGIIGLCFYPEFLGGDVFEKIYENIFVLCDMGYENNIAIGSDFDGGKMDKRLDGIDKIPCLFEFLMKKGLKKELLDKIFYLNAHNYVAKF